LLKKFSYFLSFSLVCLLLSTSTLLLGCNKKTPQPKEKGGQAAKSKFKVGMVTDTGGLNDESFNQGTFNGLKQLQKEMNVDVKALESKRDEDYTPNLTRFARENRNLVWAVGCKLEKSLKEVAERFPKVKFGIIDTDMGMHIPKNVVALTFKDHEGSFLIGALAAMVTKTHKIGFIGGIRLPVIERFETGYIAGAKAVNPDVEVVSVYAESFTDAAKGRSLAKNMYNSGVDIIFHASGGVGKGLFDEVKTRPEGKFWAIGVDRDQSFLAPKHTLSSLIKRVDNVVISVSKDLILNNYFSGGKNVELGLKDEALSIANSTSKYVSKDILEELDKYKNKIVNNELIVPKSKKELGKFLKDQGKKTKESKKE